jgi:hypothetical protein
MRSHLAFPEIGFLGVNAGRTSMLGKTTAKTTTKTV